MFWKTRPWMACSLRVRWNLSATSLVFWFFDEGEGRGEAPEADLVQEVVGQVLGAVVHPQRDAPGDVAADGPEDVLDGHADGLERVEALAHLADVPAQAFGVPALDNGEDPDPAVVDREDPRAVCAPHHVRRVGHDVAVVLLSPHPGARGAATEGGSRA